MVGVAHQMPRAVGRIEVDEPVVATDEDAAVGLFVELVDAVAHLREHGVEHLLGLMAFAEAIESARPCAQPEGAVVRLQEGIAATAIGHIARLDGLELMGGLVEPEQDAAGIGVEQPHLIVVVDIDMRGAACLRR